MNLNWNRRFRSICSFSQIHQKRARFSFQYDIILIRVAWINSQNKTDITFACYITRDWLEDFVNRINSRISKFLCKKCMKIIPSLLPWAPDWRAAVVWIKRRTWWFQNAIFFVIVGAIDEKKLCVKISSKCHKYIFLFVNWQSMLNGELICQTYM